MHTKFERSGKFPQSAICTLPIKMSMFQSKLLFQEKKINKMFVSTLIKFYRIIPDS